jgi:Tfp pilus tip-associated adhesin PilY1
MAIDNDLSNYATLAGSNAVCIAPGLCRPVISGEGATRTLLSEESGALCAFDRAAGIVYTLPTDAQVGCTFEFLVTVDVSSNAHKVVTGADTEFLVGGVIMGDVTVAQSGDYFEANGTSITELSGEGSTTGGLLGERYKVTKLNSTQWGIDGVCHGAGTLETPFG